MIDQTMSSTGRSNSIAAAVAASGQGSATSTNQSMGEAFVSLFHQLMSRGVASTGLGAIPFELPLHSIAQQEEVQVEVREVKEPEAVEVKQEVRSEQNHDDSHEQEAIATKEQREDEKLDVVEVVEGKVAEHVSQVVEVAKPVEQKSVVQDAPVLQAEQRAAQVVAQSGAKPIETRTAEVRSQQMNQTSVQKKLRTESEMMTEGQTGEQEAQTLSQQVTNGAVKQAAAEKAVTREGVRGGAVNPGNFGERFEASMLRPQAGAPIGEAVKPRTNEPNPVVAVTPVVKASEALARVSQGLAIKSMAGIGSDRRSDVLGMHAGATLEKKVAVTKEGGGSGKISSANQAKIVEQIYKMVETALQGKSGNTIMIKLEPAELGPVAVKVTQRADQMFARVSAESPEVEEVLRANVGEIAQSLAAAGFKSENTHISIGRDRFDSEQLIPQNFVRQEASKENSEKGNGRHAGNGNRSTLKEEAVKDSRSELDSGWVA